MANLNTNVARAVAAFDGIASAIADKGGSVSGHPVEDYAAAITGIETGSPALPDLVAGGTYKKTDGSPVVITPISGETTAIRLLVSTFGTATTALRLIFTGTATIDWGDGTTSNPTSNTTISHAYDAVNPIPCGRPYGVYYVNITAIGGSITSIVSGSDHASWGGASVGNIISYAVKSATALTITRLTYSLGEFIASAMCEAIYAEGSIADLDYLLKGTPAIKTLALKIPDKTVTVGNFLTVGTISQLAAVDFSQCKISGNLSTRYFFGYATSILFNPANTELGDIDIRLNSLSVSGFVALFNSLPTVTAKTIQIGGSAESLALSAEQLAIATAKGWTVIRSY